MTRFTASSWNSAADMARFARTAATVAVVLVVAGVLTLPLSWMIFVPAFVVGLASVLCAIFAWFRADHLREVGRHP